VKVTVNVAQINHPLQMRERPNDHIACKQSEAGWFSSSDADGTIASYSWVKISGAAVTITNSNSATPAFRLAEGQYTFELTVKRQQRSYN